ncbi:hypothetical protein COO60DRAFT_1463124 [Scenedesmus sp. NREL 46B-D3]|nr:hypothetical protein COO60DRAFT_1463124 [Scenedesmus sp. NREL 46B-D3]
MAPREDFVWETDVDTASLTEPRQQLKASVYEGKLHVHIINKTHDVDLPADAFTDDISAKLDNRKLQVRIARRDPEGPAMQMPAVNMGSSVVTAMPVMVNQGGAMDTVSKGETVVRVPGSTETTHLSGFASSPGGQLPGSEELADRLRGTVLPGLRLDCNKQGGCASARCGPPGAKVLHGQKMRENEAKFDERAMAPAKGRAAGGSDGGTAGGGGGVTGTQGTRAAATGAPAGDDEHCLQQAKRGRADFTKNKVGMEYEERTAAGSYVDAEHGEPISSMKQAGVESCDLCSCAPCQCDKMRKTGGPSNAPYEMTPAETKRGGKPAIHSKHRDVTGKNAHDAHDYRGHAKQFGGGPGQRQTSDAVAGGPIKGGSKTTFTTMG